MKIRIYDNFCLMWFIISFLAPRIFVLITIILSVIVLVFLTLPNTTNESKYIGTTNNAIIEKYTNKLGLTRNGDLKIIMNNNYFCRIMDPVFPVWIEKLTSYPPYTTNKDGFKQFINCLPYISIDITNHQNVTFIKERLGREPTSSHDLVPFKQACLQELIEYNISQAQD